MDASNPDIARASQADARASGHPRAGLLPVHDGGVGRPVLLEAGVELIFGRASNCDVVLPDPSVTRRHARVRHGPDGCRIEDLGGTNGVLVNDTSVSATLLRDGDRVQIGHAVYRFVARA